MIEQNAKQDLDLILQVFSGEDGGVGFIKLKQAAESFYLQAEEGNADAIVLREKIHSFSRLCDMALKTNFKPLDDKGEL
jgi:hypothetical protein